MPEVLDLTGEFVVHDLTKSDSDSESEIEPQTENRNAVPSDHLICPLTLELPVDPVTAEDGRVYELEAIQEYVAHGPNSQNERVKSPLTQVIIGKSLVKAFQHKNMIATLIENGTISGELADTWMERTKKH